MGDTAQEFLALTSTSHGHTFKTAPGQPPRPGRTSVCIGCGHEIFDRYILRVAPDLEWHATCLRCAECNEFLDESCTTFIRDGKAYCKCDYIRLFGTKCARCGASFAKNDCVMRARDRVYHLDCFRCAFCDRKLQPGDEFAVRGEQMYCRADFELLSQHPVPGVPTPTDTMQGLCTPPNATVSCMGTPTLSNQPPQAHAALPYGLGTDYKSPNLLHLPNQHDNTAVSVASSSDTSMTSSTGHSHAAHHNGHALHRLHKDKKKDKNKATRVRTVLNEKQLATLRQCYNANSRPDALMKEQLVEMTGLNPRVIRVWFQNKRCKDKKKTILNKQMQLQHEKSQALNGVRMHGIGPLVAASPSTHDMGHLQAPLDVHQMQQSSALWTPIQTTPLDPDNPPTANAFQQLMNGFGDPSADPTMQTYMQTHRHDTSDSFVMDNTDLDSFSPQMNQSDLSSPSCSD